MVAGEALDFAFLVDQNSVAGRNLYNYEIGRLQYLLVWRAYHSDGLPSPFTRYTYTLDYQAIAIDGERAIVDLVCEFTLWQGEMSSWERCPHRLTLSLTADGWKLVDDLYSDPFRQGHPIGHDFAANLPTEEEVDDGPSGPSSVDPGGATQGASEPRSGNWVRATGALILLGAATWLLYHSRRLSRRVGPPEN